MARDSTLTVSLTKPLRQYIRDKVDKGGYESASEVVRESLRTLQEQEKRDRLYWADVRKKVAVARKAIERGDVVDGPTFMKKQLARIKSRGSKSPSKP